MRCTVTGARADAPAVAPAQVATWCENDATKCVKGPKGIIIHSQTPAIDNVPMADMNDLKKLQKDGHLRTPGVASLVVSRNGLNAAQATT